MILASTDSKPVTLFMSKPGSSNYYNFTLGTGTNADDAIEVTLARNADIQWIKSSKVLYVGCDNSEHIIRSDGPVLTPSDIETNQQSAFGSARIMGDWVSEKVGFVSLDGRRLRLISYGADSEQMQSSDITWAAEHITSGKVKEVHHAANPQNQLFCPLEDGSFITCTYDEEFGAVAWARHSLTGSIRSMTVAEEQGRSVVYALVLRDRLRLLRMGATEVFMDSYVTIGEESAISTVTGLNHLEGETVQVIADGEQRDDEVVSSNQITISGAAATDFIIGLPMPRTLRTMLVDYPAGGQSTASFKKRWSDISLRLHKSAVPLINGVREGPRLPQDVDADTQAMTGIVDIRVNNLGWDTGGSIVVQQNLPFDLNVVGIFGKISEENL